MPRLSLVFFQIVPTCQRALMRISMNQAIAAFPDGSSYNCEDHYGKPRLRAKSPQFLGIYQSQLDQLLCFREHAFVINESA